MVCWSSKDQAIRQNPYLWETIVDFIDLAHVDDMSAELGYQGPLDDGDAHVADPAIRLPL